MREKDQGITLIELIVVIAIMSVLTASLAISMTYIGKQRVSNAASSTKQLLQLAQTYGKSKGACKLKIVGTSDGTEMYVYTAANATDLANETGTFKYGNGPSKIHRNITVKYYFDYNKTAGTYSGIYTLDSNTNIDINFKRSTGAFDKSYVYRSGSLIGQGIPSKIEFTNGTKTTTLILAKNTGVVTYE